MNPYSEKTVKDMDWKRYSSYEWKCKVFDLELSIIRPRSGYWVFRIWDSEEGWKTLKEMDEGPGHNRWVWSGPPSDLIRIAKQTVWNIVKSKR